MKKKKNSTNNSFASYFERKVEDTIRKYSLFSKKDKILVACSGGKDSTAVLFILKKLGYNVQAITVDALIGKYTKENLENIRSFCKLLGIKLHVISFRNEFGRSLCFMRQSLSSKGVKLRSCTICGTLRRYLINRAAKRLKADYVVTGHNLDDEAQAVMMNLLRNNLEVGSRSGPKTGLKRKEKKKSFVQRAKPLYYCSEKEVIRYSKIMGFPVNYGRCPCCHDAYRNKIRSMLDRLEKTNPRLKLNILESFSEKIPKLRMRYSGKTQEYCRKCGEPSKGEECSACRIFSKLNPG